MSGPRPTASRRRLRFASLVLVLAVLGTGCTGDDPDPSVAPPRPQPTVGPPPEGTIRVAYPAEPATLNPMSAAGSYSSTRDILRPVLPALFRLDAALEPHPEMAESWPAATDVSADGRSVTLRLREASWSDGTPISATDVRFSWERLRDGPTRSRYRLLRDVEVLGPRQFTLHFAQPVRRWWALFSIDDMILPAHAFGDGSGWDRATPVSGGPFVVEGWTPGLKIRLRRNPRWVGGPRVEAIEVLFVPDDEMRLQLLERREVDVVVADGEANYGARAGARGAPPIDGPLDGRPGASGAWGPAWWELNVHGATLGGTGIGRALGLGVDRSLAAEILEDSGQVMNGIPSAFPAPGPAAPEGLPPLDGPWAGLRRDARAARSAMSSADRGKEVKLVFARGSLVAGALARFVHFQMRETGLRIEIVGVDAPQFAREFLGDGTGDIFLVLRRGADAPPTDAYRSESPTVRNPARVTAADSSIDRAEIDPRGSSARLTGLGNAGWAQTQQVLVEGSAVYPLVRVKSWIVSLGAVAGPQATGAAHGPFWNAGDWVASG